jgi:hypothetical protein
MTSTSNAYVVSKPEHLDNLFPVIRGEFEQGSKGSKQTISWFILDKGTFAPTSTVCAKLQQTLINGPLLPHKKEVISAGKKFDVGPKRPCVNVISEAGTEDFKLQERFDFMLHAAYEFNKAKFGMFQDLLTFSYRPVQITTRGGKTEPHLEIIIVKKDGNCMSFADAFPEGAKLSDEQESIVSQFLASDRQKEVTLKGQGADKQIIVFTKIGLKSDKKTGRLYTEMHLRHTSFPGGNRHYRKTNEDAVAGSDDIRQWGITIYEMLQTDGGNFAVDKRANWAEKPECRPVTKAGEKNYFIGRVNYYPESVMEGAGNVKVWWTAEVFKLPIVCQVSNQLDFGEEVVSGETEHVLAPSARITTKAMAANATAMAASSGSKGAEPMDASAF